MATKDYYKILNVKTNASVAEIKDSYRKLAMKYHPDRNPDDELAAAVFTDAAEAYAVLSNTETRRQYNHQRYHTAAQEYAQPAESIESLVMKAQRLKNQVTGADPYRFNRHALLYSIKQLLPENIEVLLTTEAALCKQFLDAILGSFQGLNAEQTKEISGLLDPLFQNNPWLQQQIQDVIKRHQKKERWEKYKVLLAILIALILCVVIYFATN